MPETLHVQNDDPALADREVTEGAERAALMADVVGETVVSGVVLELTPGVSPRRTIVNAAIEAARRQQWADALAAAAERHSRTYQVFRRAPNTHAKSPAEEPELVTLGDVGDTFSPGDIAQIGVDLGANRLVPLP